MEYREVIKDFAKRTEVNLKIIEKCATENPNKAFEVTQLVNSMLGLLVFPKEEYYLHIPKTSLDELKINGWPVPRISGKYPDVKDLRQLIRYMRNAITHFNIEFLSDAGEIIGIKLWNKKDGRINWETKFTINELKELTMRFIKLLD